MDVSPQKPSGLFRQIQFQRRLSSAETVRLIRDGRPRTATSTFTQLLGPVGPVQVQCCFTSTLITKSTRLIRDGEKGLWRRGRGGGGRLYTYRYTVTTRMTTGAQDGHLDLTKLLTERESRPDMTALLTGCTK